MRYIPCTDSFICTLVPDSRQVMYWYDPKAGTFASAGSMATGREGHTASLLSDGCVLIAGGQSAGNTQAGSPFASAELYEP